MRTRVLPALVLVSLLVPMLAGAQPTQSTRPSGLLAYTRCAFTDGLAPVSVERAPNLPMARPVETASGRKIVSVDDGFRVMLAYPNTDPFVNLKIERSVVGRYAVDKEAVLAQMTHIAAGGRGVLSNVERSRRDGVDLAALNNPGLEGGTLSFYSLFDDAEEVIVTAYLLNQLPARRVFQNMADYRVRRDAFLATLTACMASSRRAN